MANQVIRRLGLAGFTLRVLAFFAIVSLFVLPILLPRRETSKDRSLFDSAKPVLPAVAAVLLVGGIGSYRRRLRGFASVHQSASMTLPGPTGLALSIVRKALNKIGATETECLGEAHAVLRATTNVSVNSWGEALRLDFHPNADGSIEVHLHCSPRFWNPIVNAATSLNLVDDFLDQVRPHEVSRSAT